MNPYSFKGQEEVFSPCLVYYKDIIIENIKKTIVQAGGAEKLFPHVKTHKMIEMIKLQVEMGITSFKCATIAEAEMTALGGGKKIVLSYPLVGPNIQRFKTLTETFKDVTFYAIGDNTKQIELLGKTLKAKVLMDVDMGQHRTGVPVENVLSMYREWNELEGITMCGMHCYDGHRHEEDFDVRNNFVVSVNEQIEEIIKSLKEEDIDCSLVIMGGTPTFPCHKKYDLDVCYSPGTCIVQDFGYQSSYRDIDQVPGAVVLGRVVSRPSDSTFTIDIGVKAIASDPPVERGQIVGMEYAKTVMQNEEHWVLSVPQDKISSIPEIGDVVFAIPTHVCPTSALYPEAVVVENGEHIGNWEVTSRNRKITI